MVNNNKYLFRDGKTQMFFKTLNLVAWERFKNLSQADQVKSSD